MPPSPRRKHDPHRRQDQSPTVVIHNMSSLKSLSTSGRLPNRNPGDDLSVALSNTSSHELMTSWLCPHCGYTNGDPGKEQCAVCGIKDKHHVQDYRQAVKRHQLPGEVGSYRWFSSSEHSHSGSTEHNNESGLPPSDKVSNKIGTSVIQSTNPRKETDFHQYPPPLFVATLSGTPPRKPRRVDTPCVSSKRGQQETLNNFRTVDNKDNKDVSQGRSRPGRHGSFDEKCSGPPLPPGKRPPFADHTFKASTGNDSSSPRQPWVSFSGKILSSDNVARKKGRLVRQSSITSSTAAVKSGMNGDIFFEPAPLASATAITSTPSQGEDNSVSRLSYSSKSTVKMSNITPVTNGASSYSTPTKNTIVWTMPPHQDEDSTSLIPPRRNKSSPPKLTGDEANHANIVTKSHSLRQHKSVITTGTFVGVIYEDVEQQSTPEPPLTVATTCSSITTKVFPQFVPPNQLYYPAASGRGTRVDGKEFTVMSLANAEKLPSVSSFASSTGSARFQSILGGEIDNSHHNNNCIASEYNDRENPSVLEDETEARSESGDLKPRLHGKGSIPPSWLVGGVLVIPFVIILLSIFLSSNSSSSKFEVGTTTGVPSASPSMVMPSSMSPTTVLVEAVDADVEEEPEEVLDPVGDFIGSGEAGGNDDIYQVSQVVSEEGGEEEQLGLSVACGGGSRFAVTGHGFIRVVDLMPSFPTALTWPLQPSDFVETGRTTPVGSDINFTSGYGIPQIAFSANGTRITAVIGTYLFVWDYLSSDEEWSLVFKELISKDDVSSSESSLLSTAISLSSDGRYVATGIITTTDDGSNLVVRMWDLESDKVGRIFSQTVYPMDEVDLTTRRHLGVHLAAAGNILAVCTNENVFVKSINGEDHNSDFVFGKDSDTDLNPVVTDASFGACGLSGDGRVLAVSSRNTNGTAIYSAYDSSWKTDEFIPVFGSTISLDYRGELITIGGSPEEVFTLWGRDPNDTSYHLAFQMQERGLKDTTSVSSVCLTKNSEANSSQFMAIGLPVADGRIDVYKIHSI